MELGVAMAYRDFECTLCGHSFTIFCGDLVFRASLICGDCMDELGGLEEDELERRVSRLLAERASVSGELPQWHGEPEELVKGIVRYIQAAKEQSPGMESYFGQDTE